MSRLFIGNFDFEHRLAEPNYSPSAKLKRLNAELACSWLSIAQDGDWVWTPSPIDPSFLAEAAVHGLPQVRFVNDLVDVARDAEIVPWGWSAEIRKWAEQTGRAMIAPVDAAVRLANSRATSAQLEQEFGVGLEGARRIASIEELHAATRSLPKTAERWVVKAEFGMSARERLIGCGIPSSSDENWIRRRLANSEVVFFEPWVERVAEVGIQIEVPVIGDPQLVGLTPMTADARGQYTGSWFSFRPSRFQFDSIIWKSAINVALHAAAIIQSRGYFGPLGIDAMLYQDSSGQLRIRPLQDINARWTMGRLSLGLRRFCHLDDEGYWEHGSLISLIDSPFLFDKVIFTSPNRVGEESSHHFSRIHLRKSDTLSK